MVIKLNNIIKEIKIKMIEKNISTKKLSDMVGCSEVLLKKWLNGEEEIPVLIKNNISKVLELDNEKSLNNRFDKLSDENKKKVLEYIDYLQYTENKKLNFNNKQMTNY